MNGRAGKKDQRGSNRDRRRQKQWLLGAIRDRSQNGLGCAPYGGNGTHVRCVHCGLPLSFETVERDRIEPGGRYVYRNIQPADRQCNTLRGDDPTWKYDGPGYWHLPLPSAG